MAVTAMDIPASPPLGRRREALIDLALWAAVVGVVELASVLALGKASMTVRFLVGEPAGMIALLAAMTAILRRRGQGWRDVGFARPASWGRTVGTAAAGLLLALMANASIVLLLLKPAGVPSADFKVMMPVLGSPWTLAGMVAISCTTVAFGEEMQFRGFLFSRLEALFGGRSRWGTTAALVGQAALFGLPHIYQGLGGAISTGGIGLVLGGLYLFNRRNLTANILLHATIDTASLTALYLLHAHGMV